MATIGTISVALVARTTQFEKGLKRAERTLGRFGAKMKRQGTQVAATGAAILAPFVASVKVFADYGDGLAKMSRRTGIAVGTLSRLGYAAEISGSSMAAVEKGIRRMARTMVDAQDGLMESKRAFDRIGVSVDDLAGMGAEEVFMRLAGAIGQIEDPLIRAAAAQELFGRSGTELLPLFDLGEKGLQELTARAEKLGIVLDTKTSKQAEQLTDALLDLKKGMQGVAIAIVQGLGIPFKDLSDRIAATTEKVRKWIAENRGAIPHIVKLGVTITAAGVAMIVLGQAAIATAAAIYILRTAIAALSKHPLIWLITLGAAAVAGLVALAIKSGDAGDAIDDQAGAIEDLNAETEKLMATLDELGSGDPASTFEDMADAAEDAADKIETASEKLSKILRQALYQQLPSFGGTDLTGLGFEDYDDELRRLGTDIGRLTTLRGALQSVIDRTISDSPPGGRTDAQKAELARVQDSYNRVDESLRRIKERHDLIQRVQRRIGDDALYGWARTLQAPLKAFDQIQAEMETLRSMIGEESSAEFLQWIQAGLAAGEERLQALVDVYGDIFGGRGGAAGTRLSGFMERGSREAYSTIVQARFGAQDRKPEQETARNTGSLLEEQRETNRLLRDNRVVIAGGVKG